jgi:hypothetical protein
LTYEANFFWLDSHRSVNDMLEANQCTGLNIQIFEVIYVFFVHVFCSPSFKPFFFFHTIQFKKATHQAREGVGGGWGVGGERRGRWLPGGFAVFF